MPLALLNWQNKLAFPNRLPGFDPSHPAASGALISCIYLNKSFVDLLSAKRGTINGTPTSSILSTIGPCFTNTAAQNSINFAGRSTATIKTYTAAAIVCPTTISNFGYIFHSSTLGGAGLDGVFFIMGNTGGLDTGFYNGTNFQSGIALSANASYFLAASVVNTSGTSYTVNFAVVNLATGQVRTSTTSGTSSSGPGNGTFAIGSAGQGGSGSGVNGSISSFMFSSGAYLSIAALKTWAADPWSFWYPPTVFDRLSWLKGPAAAARVSAGDMFHVF